MRPPKGLGRRTWPRKGPVASKPADPYPPWVPAAQNNELPKIAEIKKAVDDAAAVGGGLWLSYLFVLFYLAVAAGAVTHADLFLENPVKLPFLNIELPLLALFFLAPILFLIVHAYTLVHLVMLTEKAKRFDQARDEIGHNSIGVDLQWQLPNNIFVQFLAGPSKFRGGTFGRMLRVIAWVTLVVAPVLLLLLMQIQFLPFHSFFITWFQRFALFADLALIWWLWRKVLSERETEDKRREFSWTWTGVGLAFSVCLVFFSWAIASYRGEWQEDHLANWRIVPISDYTGTPTKVSLHNLVFNSEIDPTTRRRWLPFSNTLVLSGLNVYEGLGIDDPQKAKWREFVFRARGRDLRGAIFDFASLPKVDFEGAQLQGASLKGTVLQGASLDFAQLQGASLEGAKLQGASLNKAHLEGASLDDAQLQGASLISAQLQGASLIEAQLQGAYLDSEGTECTIADGGKPRDCAPIDAVQLQGASLDRANLQGAWLLGAQLQGASLDRANLQGALLDLANMEETDLSDACFWRTNRSSLEPPKVKDVRLSEAPDRCPRMDFVEAVFKDYHWNDKAYQDLRRTIELLPTGALREEALDRIRILDCANPDKTLASCDPSVPLPPEADAWLKTLEEANVDDEAYAKALAAELRMLVCSRGDNALYVLRGLITTSQFSSKSRLGAAGSEAPTVVDFIVSKDCPVSASLTDADKEKLLSIKQHATKKPGS